MKERHKENGNTKKVNTTISLARSLFRALFVCHYWHFTFRCCSINIKKQLRICTLFLANHERTHKNVYSRQTLLLKHTIDAVPLPGDHSLKLHRAPPIHSPELSRSSQKRKKNRGNLQFPLFRLQSRANITFILNSVLFWL